MNFATIADYTDALKSLNILLAAVKLTEDSVILMGTPAQGKKLETFGLTVTLVGFASKTAVELVVNRAQLDEFLAQNVQQRRPRGSAVITFTAICDRIYRPIVTEGASQFGLMMVDEERGQVFWVKNDSPIVKAYEDFLSVCAAEALGVADGLEGDSTPVSSREDEASKRVLFETACMGRTTEQYSLMNITKTLTAWLAIDDTPEIE